MIERESTDLPQPDSPTMPIVLPRSSVNETPSTACTSPRGVLNCVLTSETSSSDPSSGRVGEALRTGSGHLLAPAHMRALPHVELRAHHVAEIVQGEHRREDQERRDHPDRRGRVGIADLRLDHVSPRRARRGMLRPKIASAPSRTMTTATLNNAIESIAGTTFGKTSRSMTRMSLAPCARAAMHELALRPRQRVRARDAPEDAGSTRSPPRGSRSRTRWPQPELFDEAGDSTETSVSARTSWGNAKKMLKNALMTVSVVPPLNPANRPRNPPISVPNTIEPTPMSSEAARPRSTD